MPDYSDKPGYSFKPGAPPEVRRYFKNKSLKPSFDWEDVEPDEHAASFAVAKAMNLDVLSAIQGALMEAMEQGIPYEQFAAELRPKLQKLGWWGIKDQVDPLTGEARRVRLGSPRRLRTIYQANVRSARAAGQWERIQRTKEAMPYLIYLLGPSERHRPHHRAKAGTVLPVDDPFWISWYPPNGWGCKCHVRQISRREAQRRGISDAPVVKLRDVVNARTGEMRKVPQGIDPGWERNPGLYRHRQMENLLTEKLTGANPEVARVAARDLATSWRAQRIHDGSARGAVPVALMPPSLALRLGSRARVVKYSDYTATKARTRHPEVTPDNLVHVDRMLREGTIYDNAKPGSLYITERRADGIWALVVKGTQAGDEVFVSTYYRISERYARRNLTADKILREGN